MYRGRFAPSPTGPLHLGSLVAALVSYLDAKQHQGQWLVRIEDIDSTRAIKGMADEHLRTLETLGFDWDGAVVRQSHRNALYHDALERLRPHIFPCNCSRTTLIQLAKAMGMNVARGKEIVYLGTCRKKTITSLDEPVAIRLALPTQQTIGSIETSVIESANQFLDRWLGLQKFDLHRECGDFVLRRADGIFSYQLAVVVDDIEQGITHIVRGKDLLNNTPRQTWLRNALTSRESSAPTQPWRYAHLPLVLGSDGEKLSKQNGATSLNLSDPVGTLNRALAAANLPTASVTTISEFWQYQLSQSGLKNFAMKFPPEDLSLLAAQ